MMVKNKKQEVPQQFNSTNIRFKRQRSLDGVVQYLLGTKTAKKLFA